MIKSTKYNYNEEPFPENESDDEAHERCDNDEGSLAKAMYTLYRIVSYVGKTLSDMHCR